MSNQQAHDERMAEIDAILHRIPIPRRSKEDDRSAPPPDAALPTNNISPTSLVRHKNSIPTPRPSLQPETKPQTQSIKDSNSEDDNKRTQTAPSSPLILLPTSANAAQFEDQQQQKGSASASPLNKKQHRRKLNSTILNALTRLDQNVAQLQSEVVECQHSLNTSISKMTKEITTTTDQHQPSVPGADHPPRHRPPPGSSPEADSG